MSKTALTFTDHGARELSYRSDSVATAAALTAIPAALRGTGDTHMLESDGTVWRFDASSSASDSTGLLVKTPDAGTGRWIREGSRLHVYATIAYTNADADVLFTVPTGFVLSLTRAWWEVGTGWTGGSSSAIGLSSSNASYNTKGDLLGGATGDVAATLVTGKAIGGTVGAKFGSNGMIVLVAGNTVKFDRITSAFTAGTGYAHLMFDVLAR